MKGTCIPIYSLLLLCGSVFCAVPSASGQACTPVVYAFRHAEDFDSEHPVTPFPCLPGSPIQCNTALTPIGEKHADLYQNEMIPNFEEAQDYCPVGKVLAVSPIKPGNVAGTTNPYFTAEPLSEEVSGSPPITALGNNVIDEKFAGTGAVTPAQLHDYLIGITEGGDSAALFWTSEGLHDLGKALGTEIIPKKASGIPPRNASYVFRYDGSDVFVPPVKATEYVQCFNYKRTNSGNIEFYPNASTPQLRYYCGTPANGNLDENLSDAQISELHARICATDALTPTGTSGYYGYCVDGQ